MNDESIDVNISFINNDYFSISVRNGYISVIGRITKSEMENFIKSNADNVKIDYIEIVNYENMKNTEELNEEILIAEAVYIDNVRLIDNCILKI